jgi:hypothetical protein
MSESNEGQRIKTVVTTDIRHVRPTTTTEMPMAEETEIPSLLPPDEPTTTGPSVVMPTVVVPIVPWSAISPEATPGTSERPTTLVADHGQADLKSFVEHVHASQIGMWVFISILFVGCLVVSGVAFYCHKQQVSILCNYSVFVFLFLVALWSQHCFDSGNNNFIVLFSLSPSWVAI